MNRFLTAAVAAGLLALPFSLGEGAAFAQTRAGEEQTCRDITAAALLAAANASGLSAAVTSLAVERPGCATQLVRAVNSVISQAPADQRRALADQAAAGFVSAQQALIEVGNVAAATTLAGIVAASGSSLLQTAFAAASANNPVRAGGGGRPVAQIGAGNAANSNAAVLTPSSLGGGGGSGGSVSPVKP